VSKKKTNKPRSVYCNFNCRIEKDCWRAGHIPYAALLYHQYGLKIDAWRIIFRRWIRIKKFAWPGEVCEFFQLFESKYPQLCSTAVKDDAFYFGLLGAVSFGKNRVTNVFGRNGVFDGEPITPKPQHKESIFFQLALNKLNNLSKKGN
jgi:hypothetical protein